MAHQLSHKHVNLARFKPAERHRVKDSILLVIVFLIGLIGTCYILHFALSQKPASGYHMDDYDSNQNGEAEAIYVTAASR